MFTKGASGNPNGKPAGTKNLATRLRDLVLVDLQPEAEKSFAKLVWLRDNSRSQQIQLAAAIEIKNTIWGKPPQGIDLNSQGAGFVLTIVRAPEPPK